MNSNRGRRYDRRDEQRAANLDPLRVPGKRTLVEQLQPAAPVQRRATGADAAVHDAAVHDAAIHDAAVGGLPRSVVQRMTEGPPKQRAAPGRRERRRRSPPCRAEVIFERIDRQTLCEAVFRVLDAKADILSLQSSKITD